MKVRPSVKKMCDKCKIVKRQGVVRIICDKDKDKAWHVSQVWIYQRKRESNTV